MNRRSTPSRRFQPRAPRSPRLWALAGLLLGVLPALAVFAPAQWLASGLARASGGQVRLAEARGTVWTGSAQLVLTGGADSQDSLALPGRVQWQLRPGLTGLRASLRSDCCARQPVTLAVAPRWGGAHVAVANAQSQWPASVLTGLGTPWNTLQPQGQLNISTDALVLDWAAGRLQLSGGVRLDALAMSSRLSTLRPMGSYRLQLAGGTTATPSPTLTLSTLDGALLLSGSGQWVGQRLRFNGEATAAPGHEAQLSNLLNIIGRRSGARSVITLG
ncbi:MAG: type II secretion system protein N [Acidovorax sp.]